MRPENKLFHFWNVYTNKIKILNKKTTNNNYIQTIARYEELEKIFFGKYNDDLSVSKDFFDDCEREMLILIMDNHWYKFVNTFKKINE